ncbi:MAG: PASTA domain-containing protein [Clostridia bacterium]|nr:PASTA domain-containing protein [Clostridia bacterium]
MKYKFTPSKKERNPRSSHVSIRLKGSDKLRPIPPSRFYRLSDPEPFLQVGNKRKAPNRFRIAVKRVADGYRALFARMRQKRKHRREWLTLRLLRRLCLWTGAATALTLCVIFLVIFAPFGRPYMTLTVPDLTGKTLSSLSTEELPLNLIVHYEKNPSYSPDTVISQIPRGGVSRRIYSSEAYPDLVLTVSQAPAAYTLEDLSGKSLRDASLVLQNRSLRVTATEEYSSRPLGTVLSTDPPSGTSLYEGDTVTLRVSGGQKPRRAYVPDLSGLSESAARDRLQYAGLSVGRIQYQISSLPMGTVIDQQIPAYTMVQASTEISFCVSLGDRYMLKTVPDLYGRSETEAAGLLREYGLTVGRVYPIGNAAPRGTVISQSPLPGTPLTSSVWSVDIYVSSP